MAPHKPGSVSPPSASMLAHTVVILAGGDASPACGEGELKPFPGRLRRARLQATVALTADTAILATLQDRVDGLHLHAVETDPAAGSFTIFLSTAAARDVRIGWFALG